MSSYHQKPQNLSELKQREHAKTHDEHEQEVDVRDRTNKMHNNPKCLCWISREDGIFRILDTAELARKWGYQHKNPNMTYEKMSRAMRFQVQDEEKHEQQYEYQHIIRRDFLVLAGLSVADIAF
ncbi:hypothetical protein J437_LFUL002494 [Ladona fulva]|uniref:ETS domain-containing protein n=1 Tax=Ladona fulva TaxID=123851 RepID=A0A8K0JSL2_LADFU|nr:hypothetical protein J437_LFUL002494 [Ladona fulva]